MMLEWAAMALCALIACGALRSSRSPSLVPSRARRRTPGRATLGFAALACVLAGAPGAARAAPAFETSAPFAILVDFDTGATLLEKNADEPTPPASLAKLMTMAVVFREIEAGRLDLDDEFTVSEKAWRTGGSRTFLPVNSRVKLRDLIQGVIVQSGNDASVVIAEGIAGSEQAFADMMNRLAAEIGMKNSRFANPHGLHHPDQVVTVRDLALLAAYIIREHPEHYRYYSQPSFTFNEITQRNRNPLLGSFDGADGMKTGYTTESGYGLVGSAVRDGRRLIAVVNGLKSAAGRGREAAKLLDWGFRAFEQVTLFQPGETVGEARVYGGAASWVPLVGTTEIRAVVPRGHTHEHSAEITYEGPVEAPVQKGQQIGTLRIQDGQRIVSETQLYAGADIPPGSLVSRAFDAASELIFPPVAAWFRQALSSTVDGLASRGREPAPAPAEGGSG